MTYFVKYRRSDGVFAGCGSCDHANLNAQLINRPDLALIECLEDPQKWVAAPGGGMVSVLTLDPVRAFLSARVDEEAEAERMRFITPGAGMAMTYLRKEQEARAYLADGELGPMLEAEAAATGQSVADLAAAVVAAADLWAVVGAAIEGARMAAKRTIANTDNLKIMDEAAAIDWSAVTNVEA
ncbi:hypothetical protein [Sphingomonas crocodyli]|uniref:Uncharacterized protein n=1 Tax=Sphingomonas crocodyli TaxID=1979270 RepID=A0A437M862_9SPHN|nr:hypothetical protein [Sphingomonas crocodyli]RVT93684.1 hypothetical protein EOD43_07405 [Sphingomonas crocodyli]